MELRRVFTGIGLAAALAAGYFVLIVNLVSPPDEPSTLTAAATRKTAPDFALKDADGSTVKLSDYRGKVVLLDFWATWCGPCKIEIPWFIEFERDYRGRGFSVVGVSMDEIVGPAAGEDGWRVVTPFSEERRIHYRVLMGDAQVDQMYALDAFPTTYLIDQAGKIASVHAGLAGKGVFETEIETLLQERASTAATVRGCFPAANC